MHVAGSGDRDPARRAAASRGASTARKRSLFMMEDKGLPFPGPNFFESLPTYQTLLPDT